MSHGRVWTIRSSLRNQVAQFGRPKGALVGYEDAVYKGIRIGPPVSTRVTLPGDTLQVRGDGLIVGGSGRFSDARGIRQVVDIRRPKDDSIDAIPRSRFIWVYRLTVP